MGDANPAGRFVCLKVTSGFFYLESKMEEVDLVISINVYKFPKFLLKQLKNIEENVLCKYVVVLNCNDVMKTSLLNITLPNNIHINPEIINKRIFHGSITKGIVSNMEYAAKRFKFTHFLILSGRTVFYKTIALSNFDSFVKKWKDMDEMKAKQKGTFVTSAWRHWPSFTKTQLAKHYLQLGYLLHGSEHEGLYFSFNVVNNILKFLSANKIIATNLFEYNNCVEEFSLHTIASNEIDVENLEYGFYNLGHGAGETYDETIEGKYTRKILYVE